MTVDLVTLLPAVIGKLDNPQTDIPRIAKDAKLTSAIEAAVRGIPTRHALYLHDARDLSPVESESVHLVVTSPPYWTLKEYRRSEGQLVTSRTMRRFFRNLIKYGFTACVCSYPEGV